MLKCLLALMLFPILAQAQSNASPEQSTKSQSDMLGLSPWGEPYPFPKQAIRTESELVGLRPEQTLSQLQLRYKLPVYKVSCQRGPWGPGDTLDVFVERAVVAGQYDGFLTCAFNEQGRCYKISIDASESEIAHYLRFLKEQATATQGGWLLTTSYGKKVLWKVKDFHGSFNYLECTLLP